MTTELLLKNKYSPVTNSIGFLECSLDNFLEVYIQWQKEIGNKLKYEYKFIKKDLNLELGEEISSLFPLSVNVSKHLFIPTESNYIAYLNNLKSGTDAFSTISYLAERIGTKGIILTAIEPTAQQYEAFKLAVYGSEKTDWLNTIRSIGVYNDGGLWKFIDIGKPFDFEETATYSALKIKDRFNFKMLNDYCEKLDLRPFDEQFYKNDKAVLIERRF